MREPFVSHRGAAACSFTASIGVGRMIAALSVLLLSCTTLSRFTGSSDPLTGRWREIGWVDCTTGLESIPGEPIGELAFRDQGTVTVTWHPFETYVDYRGTYELSDEGAMVIVITWSAYEPPDFDGEGAYRIEEDGSLVLEGMWLGSAQHTQGSNGCGHRFERMD